MDSQVSSDFLRIVKVESNVYDYNDEIKCLEIKHQEQVSKLCHEIENSSKLIHQLRIDIDSMRILFVEKDRQYHEENMKLKNDFNQLKIKYDLLNNEMYEARKYILHMIENLD